MNSEPRQPAPRVTGEHAAPRFSFDEALAIDPAMWCAFERALAASEARAVRFLTPQGDGGTE